MFDIEKAKAKGMDAASIAIMEKINANNAKRDSCVGHTFVSASFAKYVCTACGYEADVAYVSGYNDAIKHFGKGTSDER